MTEALLSYARASVGYGAEVVVRDASLVLRAGEVVGLVGPNGAGKSTLLRAVMGDADLLGGAIEIAGEPLARLSAMNRAKLVGVVPQQVTAAFSFPAVEFVEMGRHPHLTRFGRPGPADRAAVERAMALTDTEHLADKPVDALSGGDLQRLALAQALATEPRLLLLDEPVSHLDLNHRMQVLDLTRDLADSGLGVLAVFHDLDLAARYADRIAVVTDSALREAASPEQVIDAAMLHEVFGVRAVVGTDPVTGSVAVTPVLRDSAVAPRTRGSVMVVGGSGVAAPLVRRLVLSGWQVSAAALNAGDADATLAEALGIPYVSIPAFAPMDDAAKVAVAELAGVSDAIVICEVPFGRGNVENLAAAVRSRRPLVLVGEISGRDFTGGSAEELWAEALAHGARQVARTVEAEAVLDELVPADE